MTTATLSIPIPELLQATSDRVLVIAHDGAVRKILQRLFSTEGYEVDVAPGGVAGLEILGQRPHSAVVLDLPFPAASAADLCRRIVNLMPGLPFVILSASADPADKILLLKTGADDYVTIPFSPKELLKRLRALMRRRLHVALGDPDSETAAKLHAPSSFREKRHRDVPPHPRLVNHYDSRTCEEYQEPYMLRN